jgi:hypothetical protein
MMLGGEQPARSIARLLYPRGTGKTPRCLNLDRASSLEELDGSAR